MKICELGRTGIEVSAYCLGTMMFGKVGNPDHDDCIIGLVHRALDAGINFFDTADVYSYSETEGIVGNALRGRRDDVVPATKVNCRMGEGPNRHDRPARYRPRLTRRALQPARCHALGAAQASGRRVGCGVMR